MMERVQSKFVIVKQMKELRFCEGVNIELDHLWTSKASVRSGVPVSLNYAAPY